MRDDLNRTTRDDDLRTTPDRGMANRSWIAIAAVIIVLAIVFMWAPWKGSTVATNNGPNTTVGSSTRPAAPVAPTAPAPTTPAAPSK
jgi:hypothetical protein